MIDDRDGYTPTPRCLARDFSVTTSVKPRGLADGIVVTPSQQSAGGWWVQVDRPTAGPREPASTGWIHDKANEFLMDGLKGIDRIPFANAKSARRRTGTTTWTPTSVISRRSSTSMAIRGASLKLGVDPLGEPASATGR